MTVKVIPELADGWADGLADDMLAALAQKLRPFTSAPMVTAHGVPVGEAHILRLQPGDKLLLCLDPRAMNINPDVARQAAEDMHREFGVPVVVAVGATQVSVVRSEDGSHAT